MAGAGARNLRVVVDSSGAALSIDTSGGCQPFENDFFQGSVFFAHRPPPGSLVPFEYGALLDGRGDPPPRWELQIQGRFKVAPSGTVFFGFELWDGPMQLGLVTRSLCKVILKFGGSLAKQRNMEIRHSFGSPGGERPLLAFPLTGADRIYCSEGPVSLPIMGDDRKGAWRFSGDKWVDVNKSTVSLQPGDYFTFMFATARLDWTTWTAEGVPGLGTLDLEQFWGLQPAHIVIFDEGKTPNSSRRVFFELCLAAPRKLPVNGVHEGVVAAVPATSKVAAAKVEEAPLELPEGSAEPEPMRRMSFVETAVEAADAEVEEGADEEEEVEAEEKSGQGQLEVVAASQTSPTPEVQPPPVVVQEPEKAADDAAVTDSEVVGTTRPSVGNAVRIVKTQRVGIIIVDDGTDLPFKVEFADGGTPAADWFKVDDVTLDDSVLEQVPKVEDPLDAIALRLDAAAPVASPPRQATRASTAARPAGAAPPTVPWYFRSNAGSIWWCISLWGHSCWRPHAHLQALCETLLPWDAAAFRDIYSVDGLERARRIAARILLAGHSVPGLLEDFLHMEVRLATMLARCKLEAPWEMVGIVDVEGCIAERAAAVGEQLLWHCPDTRSVVAVDLHGSRVDPTQVAGAPALRLTTAYRQFFLVFKDEPTAQRWAADLENEQSQPSRPRKNTTWIDPPTRWPSSRKVFNNTVLCMSPAPRDALAFSAQLLREAIAAQGAGDLALRCLAERSCALKGLALDFSKPQAAWSFWVNIFHCLLIHARLVVGRPRKLFQIVAFYNDSSYVIAGHAFSLTEIEHCILRSRMTRPRFRLQRIFLTAWQRSDEDLEQRPCLPAPESPASSFRCRPDWRLNLVLSAGNRSSSDALPVFYDCSQQVFDDLVGRAMARTLSCAGRLERNVVELPYTLYRYRDDAPQGAPGERTEDRWARALQPLLLEPATKTRVSYSSKYDWTMREALQSL